MKTKYDNYDVPIYKGKFLVVICDDVAKLEKKFPHLKEFELSELYAHSFLSGGGIMCVFNPRNEHKLTYGVIAHEAVHIANFISLRKGVIVDGNNDEPQAYLVDWVTTRIHETLIKNNVEIINK